MLNNKLAHASKEKEKEIYVIRVRKKIYYTNNYNLSRVQIHTSINQKYIRWDNTAPTINNNIRLNICSSRPQILAVMN